MVGKMCPRVESLRRVDLIRLRLKMLRRRRGFASYPLLRGASWMIEAVVGGFDLLC
jgi:hypothetical protein